ncbi:MULTISPECIES: hypothetical protein [Primorskyibacter]|uniref:Uncharacterized protein n=2 Tax=Primorskyibacter TaxID=1068904 RepID=A0A4R3JDJ2_9RHOB|nr:MULTISPECIES: hypothetical protein [Primorskyibacter]TCS63794.1 hypothetical protein EDD52_10662 [Primorskyibacter sedentarius]SMC42462.1 hypothetical protein SAMN06295998_101166 [Primorskyibacter flagellatus]
MTLITPEEGFAELENVAREVREELREARKDLQDLRQRVRTGEVGTETEGLKILAYVRSMLKAASETEAQLAKAQRDRAGIVRDYAIDFDAARSEIGCRLDRLRRCCREE